MIDMSILDFPVRTLRLLQQNGFTSALIAGGAVRDLYFDLLPRDVDVFIWDPEFSTENVPRISRKGTELNEILQLKPSNKVGGDSVTRCGAGSEEGSGGSKIVNIWNVMKRYVPFDIITTEYPPEEYVNKYFNIGLCKAYCDGNKLRFTSDFFTDVTNKTFTIVGHDMEGWDFDRTLHHHIPKLTDKFPGFRTEIAPHNKHFLR